MPFTRQFKGPSNGVKPRRGLGIFIWHIYTGGRSPSDCYTKFASSDRYIAQTFAEIITDDSYLSNLYSQSTLTTTPRQCSGLEFFLWSKRIHNRSMSAEQDILQLVQTTVFNIPEPIFLQIKQLGNVITTTKQHLYQSFPVLPEKQIQGFGGYYGQLRAPGPNIDNGIHNLY